MRNNNLKSLRKLTLQEFLDEMQLLLIKKRLKNPKKKLSMRKRHWVHLVVNNLLECPATGKVVDHCSYDHNEHADSFHYNFYDKDGTMLTIDHKTPKSKGGTDHVDNIQPMIQEENTKKADQEIYL